VAFIRAALKRLALNRENNQQNGVWQDNIQLSDARQNGTRLNDTHKKGHSADHTKEHNRVTLSRMTLIKMQFRGAAFSREALNQATFKRMPLTIEILSKMTLEIMPFKKAAHS
jgi:hypothetical protein